MRGRWVVGFVGLTAGCLAAGRLTAGRLAAGRPTAGISPKVDAARLHLTNGVLLDGAAPFTGIAVAARMEGGRRETPYVRGQREGAETTWYASGRVAETRRYARGRETGRHRGWWPDGRARFDYAYVDGALEGRAVDWFANGRPYRDFHYAAGHEAGGQRMWFADGTLRATYVVRNGRRFGLMGSKGCVTATDSAARRAATRVPAS